MTAGHWRLLVLAILALPALARGQAPDAWESPSVLALAPGPGENWGLDAATDGAGTWVAVWTSSGTMTGTGSDEDIAFSRSLDGGATWTPPLPIDPAATTDSGYEQAPVVAADADGTVVAAWYASGYALASRSTDGGATWGAPVQLNADYPGAPRIATDGSDTWVATWFHVLPFNAGYDLMVSRSSDDGATWDPAFVLESFAYDSTAPEVRLTAGATGTWIVASKINGVTAARRSTDGGLNWSAPVLTAPGAEAPLDVATDGAGTWILTARSSFSAYDIVYSRSTDDAGTWGAFSVLSPTALNASRAAATFGDGVWMMSVQAFSSFTPVASWTQRSSDGGVTWSSPVVTNLSALQLRADQAGTWLALGKPSDEDSVFGPTVEVARGKVVCSPAPRGDCRQAPAGGRLRLAQRIPESRDLVSWKWRRGEAVALGDLGDPLGTDDFAFCLYDGTDNVLTGAAAPAGGTCGTQPCWKATSTGVVYTDGLRTPDGIKKVKVKVGAAGQSSANLRGVGTELLLPLLHPVALQLPLRAQLQSAGGTCFTDTYATPSANQPGTFTASGD